MIIRGPVIRPCHQAGEWRTNPAEWMFAERHEALKRYWDDRGAYGCLAYHKPTGSFFSIKIDPVEHINIFTDIKAQPVRDDSNDFTPDPGLSEPETLRLGCAAILAYLMEIGNLSG